MSGFRSKWAMANEQPLKENKMIVTKIRKTDKRMSGNDIFQYVVNVELKGVSRTADRYAAYNTVRDWCIDTWGKSCERDAYLSLSEASQPVNSHWAWHSEYYETKIYLRTDKEANWFKLKWL